MEQQKAQYDESLLNLEAIDKSDKSVSSGEGESVDEENRASNSKTFALPLTTELLKQHQEISESCK